MEKLKPCISTEDLIKTMRCCSGLYDGLCKSCPLNNGKKCWSLPEFSPKMSVHSKLLRIAADRLEELNRRAAPKNKALTNFDRITQSPKELAKFLQGIWNGKISFDNLYCDECGNCLDGGGCKENSDETDCITRWLNQTK